MRAFILFCLIYPISSLMTNLESKVEAPNYNFSLDMLDSFLPGKMVENIPSSFGKGEVIENKDEVQVMRYYLTQIRYKFPIFIQVTKGKILDFYATLPSYFSHDLYLQSIINRNGKNDQYINSNGSSLYTWNNKPDFSLRYQGSCTITCFPVYFTGITKDPPINLLDYKPLFLKLRSQEIY
jgi:hypothetical protein